jgi:malonate-semialdehyde dehydrogenase (acetylating) / methylmalonate-semialdehyde dehydrogenase
VYRRGAVHGKRVHALGGAKNHMVVMPDADVDLAADAAVNAAYGSAGERCMAVSVLVAVGTAGDQLLERIRERIADVQVGDGRDARSDMGPLITAEHRDRVAGYLDFGEAEGAELVVDGREVRVEGRAGGFFLGPSLLDHVTPGMAVYRDEIFGPVLSVVRVSTYEQARDLVNANPYGNGVALFTRDGGTARRFQNEIEVGMVGINVPIPVPMAYYSFGGWRNSLFGDSHVYGEEGIRFNTRLKVITSRWAETPASRVPNLVFPTSS